MDFLKEMARAASMDKWGPSGSASEMMAAADKAAEVYHETTPCPFEVGDYVTPRKNTNEKGRGKPSKVVKVYENRLEVVDGGGDPVILCDMLTAMDIGGQSMIYPQNSRDWEFFDADKVKE